MLMDSPQQRARSGVRPEQQMLSVVEGKIVALDPASASSKRAAGFVQRPGLLGPLGFRPTACADCQHQLRAAFPERQIFVDAARTLGLDAPMAEQAKEIFRDTVARGFAEEDDVAVLKRYAAAWNVKLP